MSLRKFFSKVVITTLCFVLVGVTPSHAQVRHFADVNPQDWFYPYTAQLLSANIISSNTNFHPYRSLTRAELAKMAVNAATYQQVIVSRSPHQATFCDVPMSHWAISYIETLLSYGAVQGAAAQCTQGKNFFPNNTVTRAEALKILLGIYGISASGQSSFRDVERGSWYEPYVAKAVSMGLVNGYSDGTFKPHAFLSRAEMSKIVVKITEYVTGHHNDTMSFNTPAPNNSSNNRNNSSNNSSSSNSTPPTSPTPTSSNTPSPPPSSSPSPSPTSSSPTSNNLPSGELTFYALGDSLTEGDRDETDMGGYPPRLQSKIEEVRPGSRVISIGRSGNDSTGVVDGQLSTAVSARPDGALVLIGSNDMWQDCWNDNDTSADTISTYRNNMETIMSRLHSANIKIYVGLVDDQSRRPAANDICTSASNISRMSRIATAFNNIIREKAQTYNATIVDFNNSTIFTSSNTLSDDGNHPNAAGYEAMARLWFAAVRSTL